MNDKERFAEYLIALSEIYTSVISTLSIEVYWQALKDHDDDVVYEAMAEGIKYRWKYHKLPVPAQINELCEEVKGRKSRMLENAKYERKLLEWKQNRTGNCLEQRQEFQKLSKPVLELVSSVAEKLDARMERKPEPERKKGHEGEIKSTSKVHQRQGGG